MQIDKRRCLCVWLPGWPTLRQRRYGGFAPDRPLATVEAVRGVRRLAALCPLAEDAGLREAMPLAQARAICPALQVADADPDADRAGLAALAAWAERYTPLAIADPPDGVLLDIAGCAHLFGGEAALAGDLLARLGRRGLPARAALAGSAAAAWALARWHPTSLTLLPAGREAAALASLPLGLLRLDPRAVAGLVRLGVRSIGELARLPRGEVAARFGQAPVLRLDQAFGAAAEPIPWPHPPAPWSERAAFAEPIGTPEDLARALRLLADRLGARLAAARQGGLRFAARFLRTDGERPTLAIATARPVHDAAYIAKLFAARLDTLDPGFGVDAVVLDAEAVAPARPDQGGLADLGAAPAGDLAATLDDLTNRLGEGTVWRPAPVPSHVPERAIRRAPPLSPVPPWQPPAPRPVRLLRRPELIDAMAPVPDDPPVLFRWRGAVHRIRAARGPERIAAEWWRGARDETREEADLVRDYYHVEDFAGARFWVFRTGRHAGAPGTRWFLHGVFG
jgi:protein ImuB